MLIEKPLTSSRITVQLSTTLPVISLLQFGLTSKSVNIWSDSTTEYVDSDFQKALSCLENNPDRYYLTVVLTVPTR